MSKGSDWLEPVLAEHLRPMEAPEGFWEQIQIHPVKARINLRPAWVLAAALPLLAILWYVRPVNSIQSSEPGRVRSWVKQRTGMDIPLPDGLSRGVRLESARVLNGQVEIAYAVDSQRARLTVSRAVGEKDNRHRFVSNASWTMRGQLYTLASVDLAVACQLCHADSAVKPQV